MSDIDGYFAETPYPPHLPRAFAPAWIDHALRHGGRRPNRGWRSPFRYLDLGCGNGLHLIAFAAAHPEGRFVGTDANAGAMARAAAIAEGLDVGNVQFRAETFAATLADGDDGFDYLAALGVLGWVSAENRALVIRIAGRFLAKGGAAALGYNALPGRAAELVTQRLILDEAKRHNGPQADAIERALDRIADLAAVGAQALTSPRIQDVLAARRKLDRLFLPHEYLAEHWAPLHSADVIRAAEAEGLSYAGSLTLIENRPDFLLRQAQRAIVDQAPDTGERERLIDLCIDQSFRRDLYVKAANPPENLADDRLGAWFLAAKPAAGLVYAFDTPAGRLNFDNPAARAIVTGLQAGPARLASIAAPGTAADRLNALDALIAAGVVEPADAPSPTNAAPFNAWTLERAGAGAPALPALATDHGVRGLPPSLLRALADGAAPAEAVLRLGLDQM